MKTEMKGTEMKGTEMKGTEMKGTEMKGTEMKGTEIVFPNNYVKGIYNFLLEKQYCYETDYVDVCENIRIFGCDINNYISAFTLWIVNTFDEYMFEEDGFVKDYLLDKLDRFFCLRKDFTIEMFECECEVEILEKSVLRAYFYVLCGMVDAILYKLVDEYGFDDSLIKNK